MRILRTLALDISTLAMLASWQLAKVCAALGQPEASNCVAYAMARYRACGGYIVLRKSRVGWWPHAYHLIDLNRITEYVPAAHKEGLASPPRVFQGTVAAAMTVDFDDWCWQ